MLRFLYEFLTKNLQREIPEISQISPVYLIFLTTVKEGGPGSSRSRLNLGSISSWREVYAPA